MTLSEVSKGVAIPTGTIQPDFKASICTMILNILEESKHFQRQIINFMGRSQHDSQTINASDKNAMIAILRCMNQNVFFTIS